MAVFSCTYSHIQARHTMCRTAHPHQSPANRDLGRHHNGIAAPYTLLGDIKSFTFPLSFLYVAIHFSRQECQEYFSFLGGHRRKVRYTIQVRVWNTLCSCSRTIKILGLGSDCRQCIDHFPHRPSRCEISPIDYLCYVAQVCSVAGHHALVRLSESSVYFRHCLRGDSGLHNSSLDKRALSAYVGSLTLSIWHNSNHVVMMCILYPGSI